MTSGWNSPANDPPMNGTYLAFSVEELTTIEFAAIDTTSGW